MFACDIYDYHSFAGYTMASFEQAFHPQQESSVAGLVAGLQLNPPNVSNGSDPKESANILLNKVSKSNVQQQAKEMKKLIETLDGEEVDNIVTLLVVRISSEGNNHEMYEQFVAAIACEAISMKLQDRVVNDCKDIIKRKDTSHVKKLETLGKFIAVCRLRRESQSLIG